MSSIFFANAPGYAAGTWTSGESGGRTPVPVITSEFSLGLIILDIPLIERYQHTVTISGVTSTIDVLTEQQKAQHIAMLASFRYDASPDEREARTRFAATFTSGDQSSIRWRNAILLGLFVTGIFGLLRGVTLGVISIRRARSDRCIGCGYDLSGALYSGGAVPSVCPECGRPHE